MKLVHIDASVMGDASVTRQVSKAAVDRLREIVPGLEVIYRDLSSAPLPHLASLPAAEGEAELNEFLAADIVVIGAPMYNFTVPSQLKAWIDRILIAGKTFRYGSNGVEGLAGDKRVIVAISRGGFYGAETASAAAEHVETYLRAVFGFIGIAPEFIVAEGTNIGPEHRERALAGALQAATSLKAA